MELRPWQLYLRDRPDLDAPTPQRARALYSQATRHGDPELAIGSIARSQASYDGQTHKVLLRMADGAEVETVLLRHHGGRHTVCVSSQAGCAFRCAFCATGLGGFGRHLRPTEILEQVLHFARMLVPLGARVTNVVFMGMGEPFHNFEAVRDALRLLTDEAGVAIAPRRVTVSTVGLPVEIRRFAQEGGSVRLALSLHAPTQALRARLMPVAARYPLAEVLEACRDYRQLTGRHVFFEYLMLAGVNDDLDCAESLADLLLPQGGHLNLIPYNPTPATPFEGSPAARVSAFHAALRARGLPVTVRHPMGRDIAAACGQLRGASS